MTYKIVKETSYDEKGKIKSTSYFIQELKKYPWWIRLFSTESTYWSYIKHYERYPEGGAYYCTVFTTQGEAEEYVKLLINGSPINTQVSEIVKIVHK